MMWAVTDYCGPPLAEEPMPNLNLTVNIEVLSSAIDKHVFPMLNQAVRAVSQQTASDWQAAVYGAKLWSGEKDRYAGSISWRMTGDFSAEVEATYKYASDIESGRPARDLKQMLNTSEKVRRTESGKRFLVIPLRHNTPGSNAHAPSMPAGVYDLAKQLGASTITGQGERASGEVTRLSPKSGMSSAKDQTPYLSRIGTKSAAMVAKHNYQWGQRLTAKAMQAAGVDPKQHRWAVGMHRFDTTTPSGAKSSAYLTFRIMMEGSAGWVVPAQPGQFLAKKVTDDMRPKANAAFAEAIKRTLAKS